MTTFSLVRVEGQYFVSVFIYGSMVAVQMCTSLYDALRLIDLGRVGLVEFTFE